VVKDYVTLDLYVLGDVAGVTPSSEHQACAPMYILENVPLLGDIRSHVMVSVHKIRSWIGPAVLLDVARVGSCVHRP
jgi:hypothetical protein